MKKQYKIILGVLVALAAIGFLVYNQFKPLETATEAVERRDISRFFTEEGRIVPLSEQVVYSQYGGEISLLAVTEGQTVNQGDLLLEMDTTELQLQLRQMQANLTAVQGEETGTYSQPIEASLRSQQLQIELAEQNLETASAHYERMESLYQAGALPQIEYEEAASVVKTARINLDLQQEALDLVRESRTPASGTRQVFQGRKDALKAQMDLLQYQLDQGSVTAPIGGIVADMTIKSGQLVTPGMPMMTIFAEDEYEVEVFILTEDVLSVSTGMEMELVQIRQGIEHTLTGTVISVAPTAVETISALGLEEQRVKVTITPEFEDQSLFFPGIRLDARFITDQQEDVLVVRKNLIFPYEEGEALWVVQGGQAQIQPITTGLETDREVVIESGLEEGDLLILNPQLEGLQEGKRIK